MRSISTRSCAHSVAAAAASALLLLAAGCGGSSGPSARAIVTSAADATAKQSSFHAVIGIQGAAPSAGGLTLTFADGDVIVPGKVRARVGGSFHGIPLRSELVVVGARHFLRNPLTGAWQEVSIGLSPADFFDPQRGVLPVIRGARDLRRDGSESVGAVDCYRVAGKVPANEVAPLLGAQSTSSRLVPIELWIGKKDSLLYRVQIDGPLAAGDAADAKRTVELSRFGEHVTITAPQ